MCGRYALETSVPELARILDASAGYESAPRYNVAPTQSAPVCVAPRGEARRLVRMRWGLVPSWAKELAIGQRMINARAETVAEKPAFRNAFRRRRCVVPADGYYEWQKLAGGRRQPWLVRTRDHRPLVLAGLWERWDRGPEPVESFTIVTTRSNPEAERVHHRMPVLLDRAGRERWLDPEITEAGDLSALLEPPPPGSLALVPVSTWVNDPRHDDPRCMEPLADPAPG